MIDLMLALAGAFAMTPAPAGMTAAAPPVESSAPDRGRVFAIMYRPGPAWRRGEPLSAQGLGAHGRYMRRLVAEGTIVAAGPLPTMEGGLVILRAQSIEAASALMAADPAVQAGLFIGEASEWNPLLDPHRWFAGPTD